MPGPGLRSGDDFPVSRGQFSPPQIRPTSIQREMTGDQRLDDEAHPDHGTVRDWLVMVSVGRDGVYSPDGRQSHIVEGKFTSR